MQSSRGSAGIRMGRTGQVPAGRLPYGLLLHFGPSHYNDLFRCEEPFFSGRGKGDVAAFVEKYKENYEKAQRKGLICIPSGNMIWIVWREAFMGRS